MKKVGRPTINEAGKTYGRLTVLSKSGKTNSGVVSWRCSCLCGREKVISGMDGKKGVRNASKKEGKV